MVIVLWRKKAGRGEMAVVYGAGHAVFKNGGEGRSH